MLSSTTGIFREPDDFGAAMREDGCLNLLVTGRGAFRARLTKIALHSLRLQSGEESCARVGFFVVPADTTLISVPIDDMLSPTWSGADIAKGQILTVGSGHETHGRLAAGGRWGTLLLPTNLIKSHAKTLTGTELKVPAGVSVWRPSARSYRDLVRLHKSATAIARIRAGVLMTSESARSLELELIGAVVTCLAGCQPEQHPAADAAKAALMGRLEGLLQAQQGRSWGVAELSGVLDVSVSQLRTCCVPYLGMGPGTYVRLRRLQLVRRALRHADASHTSVAAIAAQHGFSKDSHFARAYRATFEELPSTTLRHAAIR